MSPPSSQGGVAGAVSIGSFVPTATPPTSLTFWFATLRKEPVQRLVDLDGGSAISVPE